MTILKYRAKFFVIKNVPKVVTDAILLRVVCPWFLIQPVRQYVPGGSTVHVKADVVAVGMYLGSVRHSEHGLKADAFLTC